MKHSKKIGLGLLFLGIIFASAFFIKSNSKPQVEYETTTLTIATIENKIVAHMPIRENQSTNILIMIQLVSKRW